MDGQKTGDRQIPNLVGAPSFGFADGAGFPHLPPMRRVWNSLGEGFLDLVYPRDCAITGDPVDGGDFRYLSAPVVRRMLPIVRPYCPTCGHPIYGAATDPPACEHCSELEPVYGEAKCGYLLRGDFRLLIHAYKYQGQRYLAPDLARLLFQVPGFAEYLTSGVVVPVPLHPRKERARGFDQVGTLLAEVDHLTGGGLVIRRILRRVQDTVSQAGKSRSERLGSMRKAFSLDPSVPIEPGKIHIVFDDVFTTGSTLNACSRVLARAGVLAVRVAALAHG